MGRASCRGREMTASLQEKQSMIRKLTRRSAAKGLALSAAAMAFPAIGRAQAKSVKIAMIAPMSGPWARQGQLLRMGADLAVDDIHARGGIKSLGGAKLN